MTTKILGKVATPLAQVALANVFKLVSPTVNDAYTGGQQFQRDTTGLAGGIVGHVNTASYTYTKVGALQTSFEWSSLAVLDNYANAGENVAHYSQANKLSTGPTWGSVSQVEDKNLLGQGTIYGQEIDVGASGAMPGGGLARFGTSYVLYTTAGGTQPTIDYGITFDAVGGRSGGLLNKGIHFGVDCASSLMSMDGGCVAGYVLDVRSSGNIGQFFGFDSSNTMYDPTANGSAVGGIKIKIDGAQYYIPVVGAAAAGGSLMLQPTAAICFGSNLATNPAITQYSTTIDGSATAVIGISSAALLIGPLGFGAPLSICHTTVGAAGGATALPATPSQYVTIYLDGTRYQFPVYAHA